MCQPGERRAGPRAERGISGRNGPVVVDIAVDVTVQGQSAHVVGGQHAKTAIIHAVRASGNRHDASLLRRHGPDGALPQTLLPRGGPRTFAKLLHPRLAYQRASWERLNGTASSEGRARASTIPLCRTHFWQTFPFLFFLLVGVTRPLGEKVNAGRPPRNQCHDEESRRARLVAPSSEVPERCRSPTKNARKFK